MRKLIRLLFLISTTLKAQSQYDQIISEISNKYTPDKRTGVFEISIQEVDGKIVVKGETTNMSAKEALISALGKFEKQIIDSVVILPSPDLKGKIYGIISVSVANMRAKPSHQSELVNQVLLGSAVKILKRSGYWYLIQTEPPENYIGWIEEGGLAIKDKTEFESWQSKKKIIFTDYFGFVYSQKDKNSTPVSDLALGNLLTVENEDKNWFFVTLPDGRKGYVEKSKAMNYDEWKRKVNFNEVNLINTAKKFVGFPYLWGGTSVRGFDCSGFTKIVFKLNGFELPRDADQQAQLGVEINPWGKF
jgi:cell wall-associated NlpC family hydrolase